MFKNQTILEIVKVSQLEQHKCTYHIYVISNIYASPFTHAVIQFCGI